MLFKKFVQFIDSNKLFSGNETVLLALSSGLDSTVMVHLFARAGFHFALAHCHFQLRGADSDQDFRFAENLAEKTGEPFHFITFETREYAGKNGISIQMAARELRYQWFEEIRQKHSYKYIATAHHLDDQAETILINLIRGTGIAGLHGIPVKSGHVIRPMMFARRHDIAEYAEKHAIAYREDLSNNEVKYLRNKIRHEILPVFNSINPEFVENLTGSVKKISDYEQIADQALNEWKSRAVLYQDGLTIVDLKMLQDSLKPDAYAWFLLSPFGFTGSQITNLLGCLDKTEEKVFLSPANILRKERTRIIIYPTLPNPHAPSCSLNAPLWLNIEDQAPGDVNEQTPTSLHFSHVKDVTGFKIPIDSNIACLDYHKLEHPLSLRKWKPGDIFHPLGMKGKKKLSDFFIDLKLSEEQKNEAWLLCCGAQIVWVVGYRIDHRYRVTEKTTEILGVEFLSKFATS